ncbi:MAG: preprotein translocase subunit SecG [Bacteroidales bacterium]|jgi:preprotein translocase subunit SecG
MNAYVFIAILILIAAVLTILVVLVQNSKGGGLASNFSSSNQYMGVRKTTDFLEKFTWGTAIVILALSLISIVAIPRGVRHNVEADTELRQVIDENAVPIQNYQPIPTEE